MWRKEKGKSERRDSNPRLPAWEAGTLPTELRSHIFSIIPIVKEKTKLTKKYN